MRKITIRWRKGKYNCRILCLVSSAGMFLAYYIFAGLPVYRPATVVQLTSQISARADLTSHTNNAQGPEQTHISGVSKDVKVTKEIMFTSSMCASNQSQYTRCPVCFRPGVSKLEILHTPTEYVNATNYTSYFKTRPNVVQNLITDYLITPSLECPYLLVVQPSLKDRPWERDVVRGTWGSVAETQTWPNRSINANMKILFVVANMNSTEQAKQQNHILQFDQLLNESRLHNDILYINMVDGYYNLTLKLLSAFKWVKDNCPCTKFVLKVDFDTFVNVPLLIDMLIQHEDDFQFSVLGVAYKNPTRRGGKWAVPESLYSPQFYPYYASGCGYVLSIKVISQIVDTAPHFPIIPIEDAFITGILRLVIGYQLINLPTAFTHYGDNKWHQCQLFNDTKVLASSKRGFKHYRAWKSFFSSSCS